MRRFFITMAIAIITATTMAAQNFTEGSSQFKAQVGLLSSYNSIKIPPISLTYDYCVTDFGDAGSIGVGGIFGYMAAGSSTLTISDISIGASCSYHFTFPTVQALELYSGLMLYYNIVSADSSYSFYDDAFVDQGFGCDFFFGANYYFNDTMGVSLQFGGLATINAGLVFKF